MKPSIPCPTLLPPLPDSPSTKWRFFPILYLCSQLRESKAGSLQSVWIIQLVYRLAKGASLDLTSVTQYVLCSSHTDVSSLFDAICLCPGTIPESPSDPFICCDRTPYLPGPGSRNSVVTVHDGIGCWFPGYSSHHNAGWHHLLRFFLFSHMLPTSHPLWVRWWLLPSGLFSFAPLACPPR